MSLLTLPAELQLEILIGVDLDSLFTLRAVCPKLRNFIDAKQKVLGHHHAQNDFLNPYAKHLLNFRRPGFLAQCQKMAIVDIFKYKISNRDFLNDKRMIEALIGPVDPTEPLVKVVSSSTTTATTTPAANGEDPYAISADPSHIGLRELQVMKQQFEHIVFAHIKEFARTDRKLYVSLGPTVHKLRAFTMPADMPYAEWVKAWAAAAAAPMYAQDNPISRFLLQLNTQDVRARANPITPSFLLRLETAIYNLLLSLSSLHCKVTLGNIPPTVYNPPYLKTPDNIALVFDHIPRESASHNFGISPPFLDEYSLLRILPTSTAHFHALTILVALWRPAPPVAPLPIHHFLESHLLACHARLQHGIRQWCRTPPADRTVRLTREEAECMNFYATDPGRYWQTLLDDVWWDEDERLMAKMLALEDLVAPAVEERVGRDEETGEVVVLEEEFLLGECVGEFWSGAEGGGWVRRMFRSRSMAEVERMGDLEFAEDTALFDVDGEGGVWYDG